MWRFRYKIIADTLLLIHAAWGLILIGGTIFLIYYPWYILYHLSIVSGTLLVNLSLGGCPLTWWEEKSRRAWDPQAKPYNNSFVAAHLKRLTGLEVSPKQVNWILFGIKAVSYYISFLILLTP